MHELDLVYFLKSNLRVSQSNVQSLVLGESYQLLDKQRAWRNGNTFIYFLPKRSQNLTSLAMVANNCCYPGC